MKTFNRREWENILEKHFSFCDVEITEYHNGSSPINWYGMFTTFSNLVEGVEHYYFFKITNEKNITYTLIH